MAASAQFMPPKNAAGYKELGKTETEIRQLMDDDRIVWQLNGRVREVKVITDWTTDSKGKKTKTVSLEYKKKKKSP